METQPRLTFCHGWLVGYLLPHGVEPKRHTLLLGLFPLIIEWDPEENHRVGPWGVSVPPSLVWTLWALSPGDYGPGQRPGITVCHVCPHVSVHMSRCFFTCLCMHVFMSMWFICLYLPIFCFGVHMIMCVGVCFHVWLCVCAYLSLKVFVFVHACMWNLYLCVYEHIFVHVSIHVHL